MTASFEKIDYALRPAKHAERRMLCEVFRRLWPFQPISDYVYVGFGAISFLDFILFHKSIGIRDMISVERETEALNRVEANKPFRSVSLDNRTSSEVLPSLNWRRPHFLWLDYDDPLTPDMLLDAHTVATHAPSGTILSFSFQCHRAQELAEAPRQDTEVSPLDLFRDRFGREKIPNHTDEDDLYGWPFGTLGRRMIASEIEAALAVRNAGAEAAEVIEFRQLCAIEYQDGAKMTTLVGIFIASVDNPKFDACRFDTLDFIVNPHDPIRIVVPKLTVREIRHLERQLPLAAGGALDHAAIPEHDARSFAEFYRYLPNFVILEN